MTETEQAALDVSDGPTPEGTEAPAPDDEIQEAKAHTPARDKASTPEPEPDPLGEPEAIPSQELDVMQPGWHSTTGQMELAEVSPGVKVVVALGFTKPAAPEPVPVNLAHIETRARLLSTGDPKSRELQLNMARFAMQMITAADMGFPPAWGLKNLYSFRDGQVPELTGSGWLSIIHRQPDMTMVWHERSPDAGEATGYRIGHQPYNVRVTYQDAVELGWTKNKDGSGDSTVWKYGLASQDHLQYAVAARIGRRLLNDVVFAYGLEETQYLDTTATEPVDAPAAALDTPTGDKMPTRDEVHAVKIKVRDGLCNGSQPEARKVWDDVIGTDQPTGDVLAEAYAKIQAKLEEPM